MPSLIDQNSENRRPRRSSITHQFQRIFHKDRAGDARNDNHEDPVSTDGSTTNTPRPNGDNGSFDYSTYGPSEISSTGYSRHSSLRSFQLDSQQSATASPSVDGPAQKQDIDRSPTTTHNIVDKKDRRATKRLEAERLELEKRLFKLEEAERTGDVSMLRRESRRLTKKQPFGSSSRSSSVSGDDEPRSRTPSRITSIFSSARRRSKSRSKSMNDNGSNQSYAHGEASNESPNALPALSSTLPERLSTAISKELAARKNALLVSSQPSSQSLNTPQWKEPSASGPSGQLTSRDHREQTPYALGALPADGVDPKDHHELQSLDVNDTHKQEQADLDRALFTASLTHKKRSSTSSQPNHTSQPANPTHRTRGSETNLLETRPQGEDEQTEKVLKHRSLGAQGVVSPRSILARASTEGVVPRQAKKFKSSPLAESYTVGGDNVPPVPKRASTSASPQASETSRGKTLSVKEKATRSELSITSSSSVLQTPNNALDKRVLGSASDDTVDPSVTETRDSRTFMSRIPTSKPSQLAPKASLTKPRFYNSLNKVTGPNSGKPKAIGTLSPRRERDSSPTVPPKSPKRNSRALSLSPDNFKTMSRPGSGLSAARSAESDSDYNTADENASIDSRNGENKNRAVTAKPRAMEDNSALAKKGDLSSSVSASVSNISSGSKADSKKTAKKTRPSGRDQFVAKLFVICCRCKFWHDMPSEVYASLTNSDPLSVALDQELAHWDQNALSERLTGATGEGQAMRESSSKPLKSGIHQRMLQARLTRNLPPGPVKCCWCEHTMSKQCCQGWTTVVQMRQRHH
ncbi:uncharacterized protein BDV14DRAFT_184575 [Aspergillus stella-maris]|uniref:uncharacterized protein n=1 Tax=Aspergillus stella-maris TaxID=1810926 RepID=UPI003CCCBDB3